MLIDSHTHVQFPQFDKDRDEVVKRALDNDIWLINAGSDKQNSKQAVELANKYERGVYAAVGQHPSEAEGFDFCYYRELAKDPKVVAIGECGLNYYKHENFKIRDRQKLIFTKHIELAAEIKKPLMIHCREARSANSGQANPTDSTNSGQAFNDLIEILVANRRLLIVERPGLLHFFTGTLENAKQLLELSFYFTFGGAITFPPKAGNRDFDKVIKFLPLKKLLIETDAPYVTPALHKGKRNEPVYITEVAKKLAEIKGLTYEEVAKATTENAIKIFSLTNLT